VHAEHFPYNGNCAVLVELCVKTINFLFQKIGNTAYPAWMMSCGISADAFVPKV